MDALLGALMIFGLRICDVSVGTLRVAYLVRGDALKAVPLAFLESGIWILAISQIFDQLDSKLNMLAYAAGFAAGTAAGIGLERWIASGSILVRVVTRAAKEHLVDGVHAAGFGLTVVEGEGREGDQSVCFIVTHRRRGKELLGLIQQLDPAAFVTIDAVQRAIGGYLPHAPGPAGVRK